MQLLYWISVISMKNVKLSYPDAQLLFLAEGLDISRRSYNTMPPFS